MSVNTADSLEISPDMLPLDTPPEKLKGYAAIIIRYMNFCACTYVYVYIDMHTHIHGYVCVFV